jgi:hypothetical protein
MPNIGTPKLESYVFMKQADKNSHSQSCWLCGSANDLTLTPLRARFDTFITHDIFVEVGAKMCKSHLSKSRILKHEKIDPPNVRISMVTLPNIKALQTEFFSLHEHGVNFDGDELTENDYFVMTGLSKNQFVDVLQSLGSSIKNGKVTTLNALGMFMMKLRMGLTHRELASLFRVKETYVDKRVKGVRKAFLKQQGFVHENLGVHTHTREKIISNHTTEFAKKLFGADKLILIEDSTYIYIQKSSDYAFARATNCVYKHRYLVKPMICCTTTGLILDVFGPFLSNGSNNDAGIFSYQFDENKSAECSNLRELFEEGDLWILDRWFRGGSVGETGAQMKMSATEHENNQLPARDANSHGHEIALGSRSCTCAP